MIDHRNVVGHALHLLAEKRDDGLRVVVIHIILVEAVEQGRLLLVEQRDALKRRIGLTDERHRSIGDGTGQALHQRAAVAAVVVLQADARLARRIGHDVEGDAELGRIGLEVLHRHRLTLVVMTFENAHLIGEHDLGGEVVVGGDAREGIGLVAQRFVEVAAGLAEELGDRLPADVGAQGQRVDKHAHRVADAQVGAAVGDGGDAQLITVGEARERIEGGRQKMMRRRDAPLTAESVNRLEVQRAEDRLSDALILGIGEVGRHFRDALHPAQTLLEEVAGGSVFSAVFRSLLRRNEVGVGERLGLYPSTVHQRAQLVQEEVERSAVEDEVVYIGQEIDALGGLDNLHAVERSLPQVEGLDELLHILLHCSLVHPALSYDDRLFDVDHLNDVAALAVEMHAELGMRLDDRLHGGGELLDIGAAGETDGRRNVVDRRGGLLHAIHIDTHLRVRQRYLAHVGMRGFGCWLALSEAAAHEGLQNLVLDALHTARLGQRLGIQGHAEALVDLYGELDGHDGRQAGITQHRRQAEVAGVDDTGNDVVNLLLQDIQGRSRLGALSYSAGFLLGYGQRLLVDLLVLVKRDALNLHRHGRHHVGRLLVENEVVERFDVHRGVADDVGRNELAAGLFVEGLHGDIFDARELADNSLHLLELDAEAAYLHLTVPAADKLDVTVGQVAHDVAGAVNSGVFSGISGISGEGIVYVDLGGLLGAVEIAARHLRAADPQLAGSAHRYTMALRIHDIEMYIRNRLADRNLL